MELKDVILSTLAEMEETNEKVIFAKNDSLEKEKPFTGDSSKTKETQKAAVHGEKKQNTQSELLFLNSMRERLLVLFEGFQSPNNANIEAKIDLTLNYLEYSLATIDERVERLKKETKSESV